jgi:hypothetical protein
VVTAGCVIHALCALAHQKPTQILRLFILDPLSFTPRGNMNAEPANFRSAAAHTYMRPMNKAERARIRFSRKS